MSSSFFNPSFAFSSHLDPDGAPLGELSWSSSLAVVTISFSGLLMVVALMLACLCCKKGGIGFKELENAEGEEYPADVSGIGSPAPPAPAGPDVYVLPLSEVSLPVAEQPGHAGQLLNASDLGRQDLLLLEEMGHGWFGRVYLGKVPAGSARGSQVVVKELRSGASVQEQLRFLEEVQPYRALQHENLLRCLGLCAEAAPHLLLLEFCPGGDLKGYLRSRRVAEALAPDPLTLQRMACEVACGLEHLHRHNYVHSDLALRNCLLTAQLRVKEDYLVTADQLWVPLRWIAPELVDEVHSNLLVVNQTKASNVWSLGVTLWELFELGTQPYEQHTDRQVLAYAVRDQQLKLPPPQLPPSLSERWYEVMQFCWLQPEQRPTAQEVHLLLTYLCSKGTSDVAEDDFERRWRSLRPGGGGLALPNASSFPLLEQFSGDDVLTVTETSRGLDFEYKWEAGTGAEALPAPGEAPSPAHAPLQAPPGVVPVLSAHSPSVGSEYFIRLEELAPTTRHDPDCAGCAPRSPGLTEANSELLEPWLGHPLSPDDPLDDCHDPPNRSPSQSLPCALRSPPPAPLTLQDGEAAPCPAVPEDPLGGEALEVNPGVAGRGQWRSNQSANNNSGCQVPGGEDGCRHSCPSMEPSPQGHPLAPEGPREPLLGLQATSSGHTLNLDEGPNTPRWTEAARQGGDRSQVEPRVAEEATGLHLPLPSIPSHEDSPLPAEAASAPTSLPDSPTPAGGSQTAALDPPDDPPELEGSGSSSSGDQGTAEAIPGVLTGLPAGSPDTEGLGMTPACQAPGFLHSLSLASEANGQALSPVAASPVVGLPRALDSGYDTETYQPPQLVLWETPEPGESGTGGGLGYEGSSPGPETQLSSPLGSLGGKSPYRDSAYFSDLEAEAELPAGQAENSGDGLSPDGLQVAEASGDSSPEPSVGPQPQPPWLHGPTEVSAVSSTGRPKVFLLTPVSMSTESGGPEAPQERTAAPGGPRPPLCLALPVLAAAPQGRSEEDEEESEDSDESDEELRCYSVQEASEDSEDEARAVPVVVGESQSARSLRGLLRTPGLLPAAPRQDLGPKKKVVSFFDDVTVYLFDQESPSREVGEPFPSAKDAPPAFLAGSPGAPGSPSAPGLTPLTVHSPEGSEAEEGGGFAWGDFPLLRACEPAPATPDGPPKPVVPGPLSRFTVSPTAPSSRFSITHVSDSDAGHMGGSAAGTGSFCEEA
ncbi:serine/threonine-protein kinase LMTK1 isoform X3 [Suncus etruscus]|uniref:serine/threonine-protein kinase LMTK1 isoform X3 n=1 Tax=Suncus etruscus TaxID=109475 RepID=UPI002110DBFB|nr:serine/threonine-protein kinase LMTK1 isoform X3 [Suncus etruscus]